jgi:protein phosphatase PTC2/3
MANLGDCRAVLCRAGTAVDLTTDCKASRPDEIARIAEVGSFVSNGRINGGLQVSRAFGDFKDKGNGLGGRNVVSSEPELTEVSLATAPALMINITVISPGVDVRTT